MAGRAPILCTIFLDALGYGLLIPVLPGIVRRFATDPAFVSQVFGWFIASFAVVQFFVAPLLGSLSDRYGRRPVLLASLFGAPVDYLLMAFAPTLTLLFLGRVISGATSASIAVANAYVADISDEKSRSGNFGLVAAALGVGIVAGPGLGGALAQVGAEAPFLVAAGLNLLNFGAVWFLLPNRWPRTADGGPCAGRRSRRSVRWFDAHRSRGSSGATAWSVLLAEPRRPCGRPSPSNAATGLPSRSAHPSRSSGWSSP